MAPKWDDKWGNWASKAPPLGPHNAPHIFDGSPAKLGANLLSWANPSKCAPNLRELRGEFPEFGSKFPMSEWNFPFEPIPHNIREIEALMGMKEDYRRVGERKRDGNHFAYAKGKSGGRRREIDGFE